MRRIAVVLLVAGLLAGCGGAEQERAAPALFTFPTPPAGAPPPVDPVAELATGLVRADLPPPSAPACTNGVEERLGSRQVAFAGVARGRTTVFAKPGGRSVEVFERLNVNGYPTVFGVLAVVRNKRCEPIWYRVQLPIRPNGAQGYVRAGKVELNRVRTRIEVDLSERRLDFLRDGRLVWTLTTAIGSDSTPTPTGRYYVNQRLVAPDPSGPWGPAALGISAYSPVLIHWAQGGPIAIHGTNNPASIGQAASNGCLRLANDDLERLYERTSAGTPVVIRA
jgi:L,D-transpeptidase catalytic domain